MCHLCREDGQRHSDEDDAGGEKAMKGVATGTWLGCAPVLYETLAAVFTCRAITLVDLACILFLFNSLLSVLFQFAESQGVLLNVNTQKPDRGLGH